MVKYLLEYKNSRSVFNSIGWFDILLPGKAANSTQKDILTTIVQVEVRHTKKKYYEYQLQLINFYSIMWSILPYKHTYIDAR